MVSHRFFRLTTFSILAAGLFVASGCEEGPETDGGEQTVAEYDAAHHDAAQDVAAQNNPAGEPFVAISEQVPHAVLDIRYASTENFLGKPVTGYEGEECLLTREAASALERAASALATADASSALHGLQLHIFDCFRPQRAVDHFVRWAADATDTLQKSTYYPGVPKDSLFAHGYIAARSGHSRGSTIDLSLSRGGALLDMGTPFDYFDPSSATADTSVSAEAQANRRMLLALMQEAGFRNYSAEWWHYTLIDEPYPDTYFDLPVK